MRSTLQSKISIAMWVIAAVCTIASAVLAGWLIVTSHRESIRQQLQATATSLVSLGITHFSELKDFGDLNRFIEDALQMDRIDKIIRVYDGSRRLIFTTAGVDYDRLPETLELAVKKPVFLTVHGKWRRYETLVMPYEGTGSKKTFYLQVAIPLPEYSELLALLWWQSVVLFGFLIAVSVIVSHLLSRRLLAPVGIIAEHLEGMDPARIEDWRPLVLDERSRYLKSISDGVNRLSDRTRAAMMQLKKMSRYVAHEMRTPLTILRGEAEIVLLKKGASNEEYERVLRSSLEEIQRMSEIVDTVMEVGEQSQIVPYFQPIHLDLVDWARKNVPRWERTLERPIEFVPGASAPVDVYTDPRFLLRLVDNLVRNVRNHTSSDAQCFITIEVQGDRTKLIVEDNGPGMSDKDADSLNRDGVFSDVAGVGLNLCLRIAEMSGIGLFFTKRASGGVKVEVRFGENRV